MRITIFGATGGTGKQLVEQALAEGNEVVAFARKPSKLARAIGQSCDLPCLTITPNPEKSERAT